MWLFDHTSCNPAANLAFDEALLEWAEASGGEQDAGDLGENASADREVLRFWESPTPFVVVGRASRVDQEVHMEHCVADRVPVLRRCSGGTAVVAGPGCLMYAVILDRQRRPQMQHIDDIHALVMRTMQRALSRLSSYVEYRGTCDLTVGDQKISGNALRCKRRHVLYHGTILCNFQLPRISRWLGAQPPRQAEYRRDREHQQFVTNLGVPVDDVRTAIAASWAADKRAPGQADGFDRQQLDRDVVELLQTKYTQPRWAPHWPADDATILQL